MADIVEFLKSLSNEFPSQTLPRLPPTGRDGCLRTELEGLPVKVTIVALLVALNTAVACGKKDSGSEVEKTGTPSEGSAGEIADTSSAGMAAFLKEGKFRDWTIKQAVPIDSVSAHASKTRTFFNDTSGVAARAGQIPLPKGSVVVKDIFESDGTTLHAQAVMAKIQDGSSVDTWVWFEGALPDLQDPYYGKGLSTCTGCHGSGTDYVRTIVP